MKVFAAALMAGTLSFASLAQDAVETETLEFGAYTWIVSGAPMSATYQGRDALRLHQSGLELMGENLTDFVLEYDLAMESGNGFSGIYFRTEGDNAEHIYLRHHLSGQPDSAQYTPVLNGLAGWQIYTTPGYWQAIDFPVGEWVRVRLVVDGGQAQLSLDGQVVFNVPDLIAGVENGALSIRGFGQTGSWVANPNIRPLTDADRLPPMETAQLDSIDGQLIETWQISAPFGEGMLYQSIDLPGGLTSARTALSAEHDGIANIARLYGPGEDSNTVLAEARLTVEEAQTVMLSFGYSDRVRIYLNGDLVFRGSNMWRSRDYRYLGTITRDYSIPLRLSEGENILSMAVSENFGGWGVTGVLDSDRAIAID